MALANYMTLLTCLMSGLNRAKYMVYTGLKTNATDLDMPPTYPNISVPYNLHGLSSSYKGWRNRQLEEDDEEENEDGFRFLVTGGYRPEDKSKTKYVVSIRTQKENKFFGDNHFCGGSIVNKRTILTAAHCLFEGSSKVRPSRLRVVAGTPRRLQKTDSTQVMEVEKVRTHPKFSKRLLTNDIGVIMLKKDLEIDEKTADIIQLPDTDPEPGMKCTVVGWGTVIQFGPIPDEAVFGDLDIMTQAYCERMDGYASGMLCAADPNDHEVDSCQGDSGGPLICNDKVVGIVSFGIGCGEPDSAGIYTDVHYFLMNTNKHTNNNNNNNNNHNNQKHSTSIFYISPRLFRNKRLKQRRCKWASRLKKLSRFVPPQAVSVATIPPAKTDPNQRLLQRNRHELFRQRWSSLRADVTIDLLSDDDNDVDGDSVHDESVEPTAVPVPVQAPLATSICGSMPATTLPGNIYVHTGGSVQLSMVPNITLIPVQLQQKLGQQQQQQPSHNDWMCATEGSYVHNAVLPTMANDLYISSKLQQAEQQQQQPALLLSHNVAAPSNSSSVSELRRVRKRTVKPRKHTAPPKLLNEVSIVLTDDDDDDDKFGAVTNIEYHKATQRLPQPPPLYQPRILTTPWPQTHVTSPSLQRSPPPLAPLSSPQCHTIPSETVEEVTVSLVPRTVTTANCKQLQRQKQLQQANISHMTNGINGISCAGGGGGGGGGVGSLTSTTTSSTSSSSTSCGSKDTNTFPMLPDETTVHTVIANRIYELSLSKLREGLASSGATEVAGEQTSSQISPVSGGMLTTVSPPPAPISLKLSSDLSISLISDDDEGDAPANELTSADEAHAAVKLLQQQHPQLSVVQHLHYPRTAMMTTTTTTKAATTAASKAKKSITPTTAAAKIMPRMPTILMKPPTVARNTERNAATFQMSMPILHPMPMAMQLPRGIAGVRLAAVANDVSSAVTSIAPRRRKLG